MIRFRKGEARNEHTQRHAGGGESPLTGELARSLHARIRHAYYDRPEVLQELARRMLDDVGVPRTSAEK
ncbi:hypothetical protein HZB60_01460 [candidate division KSB1 bacterium]|nr:hypothetical protein [candidate division KSB1 bacterium]